MRVNQSITARLVRLVASDGSQIGIVGIEEALVRANREGLDLVEVAPDAKPPVCKLMDYGKEQFARQKAQRANKDAQPKHKELRVGFKIAEHDLETKLRQARTFLEKGHRLTFFMQFKARENQHAAEGLALLARIAARLQDVARIERAPFKEGKRAGLILAPLDR